MNLWHRSLVALVLLSALCGLFVHEAATEASRTQYTEPHELAADYDRHVGETVLVFGDVTAVDGRRMTIVAESDGVAITLSVTGAETTPEPGSIVQVYGELRPGRELAARRTVVVTDGSGAEWYKYAVSALGAVGFLAVFLRQWRVDTDSWTLEARDG